VSYFTNILNLKYYYIAHNLIWKMRPPLLNEEICHFDVPDPTMGLDKVNYVCNWLGFVHGNNLMKINLFIIFATLINFS